MAMQERTVILMPDATEHFGRCKDCGKASTALGKRCRKCMTKAVNRMRMIKNGSLKKVQELTIEDV